MNEFICFLFKQVFNKVVRRYKYLEKGLEEEIKKVSCVKPEVEDLIEKLSLTQQLLHCCRFIDSWDVRKR